MMTAELSQSALTLNTRAWLSTSYKQNAEAISKETFDYLRWFCNAQIFKYFQNEKIPITTQSG